VLNVAIGCDHAAFECKAALADFVKELGYSVIDFGCNTTEPCDYPDFAAAVARAVSAGRCGYGILLCGTGIGMSIAANKVSGVRAAVCWSEDTARLSREHNDANVLCLPARYSTVEDMKRWIKSWFATPFSGKERHLRRIEKIHSLEKTCCKGEK